MSGRLINMAPSAYSYPLLIKQLLHSSMRHAAEQEIVYRDQKRFTYRDAPRAHTPAGRRPCRDWACGPATPSAFSIGTPPLSRGVLRGADDGRGHPDSERAPLARADHLHDRARRRDDPSCQRRISRVARGDPSSSDQGEDDRPDVGQRDPSAAESGTAGHYEDMLASAPPDYDFPDFDENTQATTFYTSGTTASPKGVYFSHRQMVLHAISELAAFGIAPKQGRFHAESVYMPITPMFHVHAWGFPYAATAAGAKQVYPGRYVPESAVQIDPDRGRDVLALRSHHAADAVGRPSSAETDLSGLTMVIGGAALPESVGLARDVSRHRHIHRLWDVGDRGRFSPSRISDLRC